MGGVGGLSAWLGDLLGLGLAWPRAGPRCLAALGALG